jgi:cytochrome c biogenesis protein
LISRTFKRVLTSFKSVRLAAVIMTLLILLYFLGLVLPQKWMFGKRVQYENWLSESVINRILDSIGFSEIYTSPVTLVLLALFFINLTVVIIDRVPQILRKAFIRGTPPVPGAEAIRSSATVLEAQCACLPGRVEEAIAHVCKKLGYFLTGEERGGVKAAVRNRISPLGFLLFHLSFLFCLIGGLTLAYTRFSGELVLTEGQSFEGDMKQFKRIIKNPKVLTALPHIGLKLIKVSPYYEKDVPSSLDVLLLVSDGKETLSEVINVNKPIRRGPLTIVARHIGITPLVEILGPSDMFIDGANVILDILGGRSDVFKFDTDPRYEFSVLFYPDYEVVDGLERSRSQEILNPYFHLTIRNKGVIEYDGTIRPGELAGFGMFNLRFSEIRYWVEFIVIREYGKYPLIIGFALAAIGLVMRLVFYQKRIYVVIEPTTDKTVIYMDGRSEFFPLAFGEEMARFMQELEKELKEVKT